ncbi:MAG TPA: sterol desaturase family protein [Leptospiraceae bacterium]|nr:sterol desaturase [Spirochaetaceae bacterium]HBS05958.1 sterol desaturase family protein [Leptospiraceae bacterium]|tara:strand:- start:2700 stop:3875 length:1176 start_codon:yes stop_codon:yes gene_type:complete
MFFNMQIIEALIPVFILLIGIELLYSRWQRKSYYYLSDSITDMSLGMISRLSDAFVLLGIYAIYAAVQKSFSLTALEGYFLDFSAPWSGTVSAFSWILAFIVLDFLFYWSHRISHEINILWASHVVHHSSEEYNLSVALRQSALRNAITCVFYLPLAILGLPWVVFLTVDALNRLYQFWVHTKFISDESIPSFFSFLFVTPSHHRVHHAVNDPYIDKNYGGMFILWDRIFGTFRQETEEPVFGTVKRLKSYNPLFANVHVFADIYNNIRTDLDAGTGLRSFHHLWKKPSSYPVSSSMRMEQIRRDEYRLPLESSRTWIAFIQFVALLGVSVFFLKTFSSMDWLFRMAFFSLLICGFYLNGRLLQRQSMPAIAMLSFWSVVALGIFRIVQGL